MAEVAKALGVTPEAIKNFSDEAIFHTIQNNYDSSVVNAGPALNYFCTFNPMDKLIEAYENNKKLYERLLAEKNIKTQ